MVARDFSSSRRRKAQPEERLKELRISDPRTNDRIRVPEVRLVGPGGEQVGVVPIEVALRLAAEADLDLVEVAPNSKPPVAKIMDYGKFKYEAAQKAKEARRNQANTVLKEVRFRLKIDKHDYDTKLKRAEGFLNQGDKVKAMILFRGREQSRPEQGVRLLQKFAEDVVEFGVVESTPTIDGRNMTMVIAPLKNKAEARAEAVAKRNAKTDARIERLEAEKHEDAEKVHELVEAEAEQIAEEVAAAKPVAEAPADAPAEKPAAKSAAKSAATKPAATASATKPAAKPAAKAAAKPAVKVATKPAAAKSATKTTTAKKPASKKAAE